VRGVQAAGQAGGGVRGRQAVPVVRPGQPQDTDRAGSAAPGGPAETAGQRKAAQQDRQLVPVRVRIGGERGEARDGLPEPSGRGQREVEPWPCGPAVHRCGRPRQESARGGAAPDGARQRAAGSRPAVRRRRVAHQARAGRARRAVVRGRAEHGRAVRGQRRYVRRAVGAQQSDGHAQLAGHLAERV